MSGQRHLRRLGNPCPHFECRAGHIALDVPFQLGDSDPMERGRIIPKAIVGRRSPGVSYNRGEGPAPDIRYRRHAGFEAVPIERSGAASREARFGTSELSGLGQLALTDQTFDPAADRYAGVTLLAV